MLRWICLFALLANALLLLWYSSQPSQTVDKDHRDLQGIDGLRFVREMNPQSLVWLKRDSKISSCVEFSGFQSQVEADAVKRFVYEQGFSSVVDEVSIKAERNYRVIVALPEELNERLEVLDYLESNEQRVPDELLGFEYLLMDFANRNEAELKLAELNAVRIAARIEFDQINETRFIVQVFEYVDRKLSNEIKEVVTESYSVQKNEKKVCQRVASPGSTE